MAVAAYPRRAFSSSESPTTWNCSSPWRAGGCRAPLPPHGGAKVNLSPRRCASQHVNRAHGVLAETAGAARKHTPTPALRFKSRPRATQDHELLRRMLRSETPVRPAISGIGALRGLPLSWARNELTRGSAVADGSGSATDASEPVEKPQAAGSHGPKAARPAGHPEACGGASRRRTARARACFKRPASPATRRPREMQRAHCPAGSGTRSPAPSRNMAQAVWMSELCWVNAAQLSCRLPHRALWTRTLHPHVQWGLLPKQHEIPGGAG